MYKYRYNSAVKKLREVSIGYLESCLSVAVKNVKSFPSQKARSVYFLSQWRRNRAFRRLNEPGPRPPEGPSGVTKNKARKKIGLPAEKQTIKYFIVVHT